MKRKYADIMQIAILLMLSMLSIIMSLLLLPPFDSTNIPASNTLLVTKVFYLATLVCPVLIKLFTKNKVAGIWSILLIEYEIVFLLISFKYTLML